MCLPSVTSQRKYPFLLSSQSRSPSGIHSGIFNGLIFTKPNTNTRIHLTTGNIFPTIPVFLLCTFTLTLLHILVIIFTFVLKEIRQTGKYTEKYLKNWYQDILKDLTTEFASSKHLLQRDKYLVTCGIMSLQINDEIQPCVSCKI